MSLAYGKKCIRCDRYYHSVNGAIPLTLSNGCDSMICLDCLIRTVETGINIDGLVQKVKSSIKADEKRKQKVEEIDKEIKKLKAEKNKLTK